MDFYEGQLSYVGHHYDLCMGGRPLRIAIIGQEYGHNARLVTLEERYERIHDYRGMSQRYYRDGGHGGRNPHMRGNTSALRVLLGNGIGGDWDGEFVKTSSGLRFHVFDAFALVNVLLCSAVEPGTTNGRSSKTMVENCRRHLTATLEILEPTVAIFQGSTVRRSIAPLVSNGKALSDHLSSALIVGKPALICSFSHPSAHGSLRWGDSLTATYLRNVVEPTLLRVRELTLSGW